MQCFSVCVCVCVCVCVHVCVCVSVCRCMCVHHNISVIQMCKMHVLKIHVYHSPQVPCACVCANVPNHDAESVIHLRVQCSVVDTVASTSTPSSPPSDLC